MATDYFKRKIKETGKAVLLEMTNGVKVWLPKSQIELDEDLGMVQMPDTMYREKILNPRK